MTYKIYDENGELMRVVSSFTESKFVISLRDGWTFTRVRKPKPVYEDAPF